MARARSRIEDHHAEWLSLVETSGPFLTVPRSSARCPTGWTRARRRSPDLRIALRRVAGGSGAAAPLGALGARRAARAGRRRRRGDRGRSLAPRRRARVDAAPDLRRARPARDASPAVLLVHASPSRHSLTGRPPAKPGRPARSIAPPSWPAHPTSRSRSSPTARAGRSSGRARARPPARARGGRSSGSKSRSRCARSRRCSAPGASSPSRSRRASPSCCRRAPASSRRSPTSSAPRSAAPSSC